MHNYSLLFSQHIDDSNAKFVEDLEADLKALNKSIEK